MKKKGIIIGVIVAIIAIGIIASYSSTSTETVNLNMGRTHGTVSTAMGSPILHQCFNWFHNTKPGIYENYIAEGKAKLVFVDLAFLGRDSPTAAQASYCAEDQGMYWEYHDLLYNSQESRIDSGWANKERLKAFAFSLGLDMTLFESCLDSGKYSKRVQYNISEAKKHGVRGTPNFIIVGPDNQQEQISGAQPYTVFKQIMDNMI
jgi:protein-disulfide isomerase